MSLLTRAAKKTGNKKKATKKDDLVVSLPDSEEVIKAMKDWKENKDDAKTATSKCKAAEEILKPLAMKAYLDGCQNDKKYHSSIKVQASGCVPLTFVVQKKASAIDAEAAEQLQGLFKDDFDKHFEQKTEITLSDEALRDIDTVLGQLVDGFGGYELMKAKHDLQELVDAGKSGKKVDELEAKVEELTGAAEDKFFTYVAVKQYHSPTEQFFINRATDPAIRGLAEEAVNKKLVKPTSPSFR